MKITPNQPFRHHKTSYETDVEVEVPDGLGFYFVSNGWAVADQSTVPADLADHMPADVAPQTEPVTLEVQDVTQNSATEVN